MAIGDFILSMMGNKDPAQQLIAQLGGGSTPDTPAMAGRTLAGGGTGGGTATPAQQPPQPQAYESPNDLMQLYMNLVDRNRKAATIDRSIGLIAAGLSHPDNREAVLGAFTGSGAANRSGVPLDMLSQIMDIQSKQSAIAQKAAQRAALPALAKQHGLDLETAQFLFDSGSLDSVIAEMSKPDRQTVTNSDGTTSIVDMGSGSVVTTLGKPKPRDIEIITDDRGNQFAVYKDTGDRVGDENIVTGQGATADEKLWRADEADRAKRGLPSRSLSEFIESTSRSRAGASNLGASGIDYGDPPKDMAWKRDAQGNVLVDENNAPLAVPISGGPLDIEKEAADKAAGSKAASSAMSGDIVVTDIQRALEIIDNNDDGGWTPATGGSTLLTQNIPYHPAYDVAQILETVRSNIGFDKLQEMRSNSPTGAALGPVSDFENRLLQATAGNMELSQDPDQVWYNLRRIEEMYKAIVHEGVPNKEKANEVMARIKKQLDAEMAERVASRDESGDMSLDSLLEKYK